MFEREPAQAFAADQRPLVWHIPESLVSSVGIWARERSARAMADGPTAEMARINGSLVPEEMEALVSAAERHLLTEPLHGFGIDLGAGIGMLSAVVAKRPAVQGVLAVDVCETFARVVIPRIAGEVLGTEANRVAPVWGSFDELELRDECLDFAVEIDSFHHSDDLHHTIAECARVLKRSGQLVCFDRAHHDDLPDWLREQWVGHVYSDDWLEQFGYPPGIVLSRRENGEHEIRLKEWLAAFASAGLTVEKLVHFEPRIEFAMAVKSVVSRLPAPLRRRLIIVRSWPGYLRAYVAMRLRPSTEGVAGVVRGPRPLTGFSVRKLGE